MNHLESYLVSCQQTSTDRSVEVYDALTAAAFTGQLSLDRLSAPVLEALRHFNCEILSLKGAIFA